jgi:hypothetical protein
MEPRAIWDLARPPTTPTIAAAPHCTPFTLPSNGILFLDDVDAITLTTDALFQPECTGTADLLLTGSSPANVAALRDPFYASTLPQTYALAATTVIAYMLFIMLLITPRTFLHEGAVVLGRRSFTNGPSGSDAGIGVGGRPWLQKVAALTVAVSLSIATADTFKVAESQYDEGIMDALALQLQVENGTQLKIIRVISDTFLWLAQAQTLIRLFPRQREKIIIKWTAFALISLDVLFSILNAFVYEGPLRPRSFVNAVPALSYLFQLALSLLYCAWVMYYAVTKRRFAFYHTHMKNICLVALLSLLSILVPVVFFVLDVSRPTLASWGDYVRWVGAAAASVAVWEWVERIEALERNDKKDGVLGREVFDGDEMLDVTPSSDFVWDQHQKQRRRSVKGGGGAATGISWHAMTSRGLKAAGDAEAGNDGANGTAQNKVESTIRVPPPLWPTRPPPTVTPVSRTDTASAESTVYAVRYHPVAEATPPARDNTNPLGPRRSTSTVSKSLSSNGMVASRIARQQAAKVPDNSTAPHHTPWSALAEANPFKSKPLRPPPEVSAHAIPPRQPANNHDASHRWDIRARLESFAASKADMIRDRAHPGATGEPLPVTVIAAPARRRDFVADPPTSAAWHPLPSTDPSRTPRSSDQSGPDDPSQRPVTQRGTVSFVDEGDEADISLLEVQRNSSPTDSRSVPFQGQNSPTRHRASLPLPGQNSPTMHRASVPVLSKPTPQRRPGPDAR